jgi:hypothetical protein
MHFVVEGSVEYYFTLLAIRDIVYMNNDTEYNKKYEGNTDSALSLKPARSHACYHFGRCFRFSPFALHVL